MQSILKRIWYILPILIGLVLIGAYAIWGNAPYSEPITINGITVPPLPTLDPKMVVQGESLYAQHCASCHGTNLEGVPEWKIIQPDGKLLSPPHDSNGHTWHHPDDLLLSVIVDGGDPSISDMPGFRDVLSDEEMIAVLTFIKSSWGQEEREFQWWITAR
nr:c-type cytochrome [Gammaproteobacteria bacterium]